VADDTYDVFVSYSRADGRHAAEIDSVLRDKGLKTFFDRRNLAAGLPWVRALEQAIGAAKAAIVLIGPRGLGNIQQYERELAFVRQTRDSAFPVVPVILPETTTDPPFDFLRVLTWIDFSHVTRVSDAPDVLQQLLTAIRGEGTAAEGAREAICPYRGLDDSRTWGAEHKAAANPGIARALPFSIDPVAVAIPATNQSEPTCLAHCSSKSTAGHEVHRGEQYWVFNPERLRQTILN
jgi:TIR domain